MARGLVKQKCMKNQRTLPIPILPCQIASRRSTLTKWRQPAAQYPEIETCLFSQIPVASPAPHLRFADTSK